MMKIWWHMYHERVNSFYRWCILAKFHLLQLHGDILSLWREKKIDTNERCIWTKCQNGMSIQRSWIYSFAFIRMKRYHKNRSQTEILYNAIFCIWTPIKSLSKLSISTKSLKEILITICTLMKHTFVFFSLISNLSLPYWPKNRKRAN